MAENKLADMSTEFAIQILKLTENIKGHYSLTNQLERSGTSVGANIREAKYAHSRPDFIAKLQIALKECYETEYCCDSFLFCQHKGYHKETQSPERIDEKIICLSFQFYWKPCKRFV